MNTKTFDKPETETDSKEKEETENPAICPLFAIASTINSNLCKKDCCQMWDEAVKDCGLKNINMPDGLGDFETKEDKKSFKSFPEKGGN